MNKSKLNIEDIVQLYREGHSPGQIAKKYGTYTNAIRRQLIKAEEPLRDKSEAQKKAIEMGVSIHPTEGRSRTEEEKLAISAGAVKSWGNMDDEERERRIQQSKDAWNKMTDSEKESMRKKAAQAIRKAAKEGSKMEKEVQQILTNNGYRFEAHKKDLVPTQKLEIDLYIPALKTIIEVDGLSHFEPIWGEEQLAKQRKFDAQKEGLILGKGFNIIRIESLSGSLALAKLKELEESVVSSLEDIKSNQSTATLKVIKYD